jgi:thiamine kinase-like enzyme
MKNLENFAMENITGENQNEKTKKIAYKFGFNKVLCHNDLLNGNILLLNKNKTKKNSSVSTEISKQNKTTKINEEKNEEKNYNEIATLENENKKNEAGNEVTFIDFEYTGYNYRAYDFANHFCGNFFYVLYCAVFILYCF